MVEDCRKAKALAFSNVDDKSVLQLVNYDGQRGSFPLSVIVLLFLAVDSSIPRPLKEQGVWPPGKLLCILYSFAFLAQLEAVSLKCSYTSTPKGFEGPTQTRSCIRARVRSHQIPSPPTLPTPQVSSHDVEISQNRIRL